MKLLFKKYIYFIILFFVFTSCHTEADEETESLENKNITDIDLNSPYILKLKGQKKFQLDSLTPPYSRSVQIFVDSTEQKIYYCFLNKLDNSIYVYDYNNTNFAFKIKLAKEGANGVKEIDSFYIQSLDSIFVHSYYGQKIHIVNKEAERLESYSLISDNFPASVMPTSTINPITLHSNKILMNGVGISRPYDVQKSAESLENPIMVVDLDNKQISGAFHFPSLYSEGAYGTMFHDFYVSYQAQKSRFIYSFPIDDYIYETDLAGYEKKHLAKSDFKTQPTKPMFTDSATPIPKYEEKQKYYLTTLAYKGIFTDSQRGFLFRVAELPITDTDYNLQDPIKSKTKKISIIILNDDFNKIGEVKMPDYKYNGGMIYVAPEGLSIAQNNTDQEDFLIVDIFEVVKNHEE